MMFLRYSPINKVIRHNLKYVPNSLVDSYISVVRSVYRVSPLMTVERMTKLATALHAAVGPVYPVPIDTIFIEQGEMGLREHFFKSNKFEGRLDENITFLNLLQILQFCALATALKVDHDSITSALDKLQRVRRVIVLSDMSISGNTMIAEVKDIADLFTIITGRVPVVVAAVVCATELAISRLHAKFVKVVAQEVIPASFSVMHPSSFLYDMTRTSNGVTDLVKWFCQDVVDHPGLLTRMAAFAGNADVPLWGFGTEGWLVVSELNTPNNSIPLLWYEPEIHPYKPPFPRVSSSRYTSSGQCLRSFCWSQIQQHPEVIHAK